MQDIITIHKPDPQMEPPAHPPSEDIFDIVHAINNMNNMNNIFDSVQRPPHSDADTDASDVVQKMLFLPDGSRAPILQLVLDPVAGSVPVMDARHVNFHDMSDQDVLEAARSVAKVEGGVLLRRRAWTDAHYTYSMMLYWDVVFFPRGWILSFRNMMLPSDSDDLHESYRIPPHVPCVVRRMPLCADCRSVPNPHPDPGADADAEYVDVVMLNDLVRLRTVGGYWNPIVLQTDSGMMYMDAKIDEMSEPYLRPCACPAWCASPDLVVHDRQLLYLPWLDDTIEVARIRGVAGLNMCRRWFAELWFRRSDDDDHVSGYLAEGPKRRGLIAEDADCNDLRIFKILFSNAAWTWTGIMTRGFLHERVERGATTVRVEAMQPLFEYQSCRQEEGVMTMFVDHLTRCDTLQAAEASNPLLNVPMTWL